MCGLAGVVFGRKRRSRDEIDSVIETFSRLLVLSEHRGPHATGAAWVCEDGACRVEKSPTPAERFVAGEVFRDWRRSVNCRTTVLMGHTRYPTQGSPLDNRNNQPLLEAEDCAVLLTHNGHIPGVARHFRRFGLPRRYEVDSELLARLACRHAGADGLAVTSLLQDLRSCEGRMAVAVVAFTKPGRILFVRRDRPLHLAYHPRRRLLLYASEPGILLDAIGGEEGWRARCVPACSAWVVDHHRLSSPIRHSFPL